MIIDKADIIIPGHGPIIEGERLVVLKDMVRNKLCDGPTSNCKTSDGKGNYLW